MQQGRECHLGKLLLRFIVILPCCLSVCQGLAILAGNPANFSCTVENLRTSLWQVKRPDGSFEAIAQNGVIYTYYTEKFRLDIQNETSGSINRYLQTLTLDEATVDDDGQYRCEEEGQIRTVTNLTVEITPVLQLKRDNSVVSTNIDVVFSEQVAITCIAEGGKPPVRLSWKVNGQEKIDLFIKNSPPSPDRMTSVIQYLPTLEDNRLTCMASGQQVKAKQEISVDVNVQYLPNCVMGITNTNNAFVITCSCKANPEVRSYEIYVNDSIFSQEMKATLPSEKSATVFCKATNNVGSFATQPESLKPFHEEVPLQLSGSALVIGLCVAGVTLVLLISIAVFAICMYRKKKKVAEETEGNLQRSRDAALMAMTAPPESYDLNDDNMPLKDTDKAENPDKEDGSKKADDQKDGDSPVSPLQEEEPSQENTHLIDKADKGEKPSTEEDKKPPEQNDGEDLTSTTHEQDLNQENENLMSKPE